MDFLEQQYQILRKDLDSCLSQKDVQDIRVIRMIGDFQLHHCVLRRYYKHHQLVMDFLSWLESERGCSVPTRNLRLAAIHSFFRYVQYEEPAGFNVVGALVRFRFTRSGIDRSTGL